MTRLNKIFSGLLVLAMLFSPSMGFAGTTNFDSVTIGSATDTQTLTLNGTAYTSLSLGSDGNWTSAAGVVTLDLAPTKFIATASSGDFSATGFTVGTGDITFANGGKVDGDTANEIRLIENSDTFKIGFSADDITFDTTDGGVIFQLTDATDGTVDFMTNNDTDDYIQISTSSNQSLINFVGQNGKITAASGSIDFDNENLTTTGTLSSGATTVTSLIIGDETFSVPADDTIRIASNDAQTIWDVYTPGTTNEDAVLRLSADASADNGDDWQAVSDGATNSLFLQNDTSGSQATILTLANTGLITTTGDITVAGTTPLVTVGDAGEEDAAVVFDGNAQDFYMGLDDSADDLVIGLGSTLGTTKIIAMTDTGVTTIEGSTDGDLTVYGAGATASDAYLRLVGDAGADASDRWQFFNDSSAGTLYIQSDISVAGTYVTLASVDANGDWVYSGTTPRLTIGDAGAEDASIVFDGHSGGFDWHITNDDSSDDLVIGRGSAPDTTNYMVFDGAGEKITLGAGTGDVDTLFVFDGTAQDFHIGLDDSADDFIIGLGGTLGTTPLLSFTDTGIATHTGSTDGDLTIYGAGTSASDAYLKLVGDAQTDATDSWQFWNDTSAATLFIGNDTSVAGTYVTKMSITSAGAVAMAGTTDGILTITGSGTSDGDSTIILQADNTTDNGDDWQIQHDGGTNNLILSNDTSGSQVAKLTVTTAGVMTSALGTVHTSEATSALTPGATPTLTVSAGRQVFTYQPADNTDATFNASGAGSAGDEMIFIFTTDAAGSGDEVMTFGTNMYSTGTLTMANLAADIYVVTFISNGTSWVEKCRTAVQTT